MLTFADSIGCEMITNIDSLSDRSWMNATAQKSTAVLNQRRTDRHLSYSSNSDRFGDGEK